MSARHDPVAVLAYVGAAVAIVAFPHRLMWVVGLIGVPLLILARAETSERRRGGCLLLALGVLVSLALPLVGVYREARRYEGANLCRHQIKMLGLGLFLYVDARGGSARDDVELLPRRDGADFLVSLYRGGIVTDPDLFLCPVTDDDNADGAALAGPLAPEHCSYAGRRHANDGYPGLFTGAGASATVLASDDDEGSGRRFNHGDVVHVLFLDGHVESVDMNPRYGTRLARAPDGAPLTFGQGGLLDPLSN